MKSIDFIESNQYETINRSPFKTNHIIFLFSCKARGQVLGEDGVRVHSLVLPGLVSSTTVHFSGPGEVRLWFPLFVFVLRSMDLNKIPLLPCQSDP